MNIALLTAAGLMAVTTGIHVFAGGPEIIRPIRGSNLPAAVRAVADVVWHGVTVMLAMMAFGLAWLALNPNMALLWMICAVQLGFAALFIFYGLRRLGELRTMPQWVIFLGIPALSLWGVYG